jgi:hypothetical protein
VDYDEMLAAFFTPRPEGTPVPEQVRSGGPARRLRDAAEPVAMYAVWSRPVNEALAEHGLDFLTSYVWGRAAALGEPAPEVVAATFAWFEPGLVGSLYEAGRAAVSRDVLLEVRDRSTAESLGELLAAEDLLPTADRLLQAVDGLDVAGRPLFAGVSGRPLPQHPAGRLQRACELVREHRGDGHAAAAVAAGLGAVEMNILTELWTGMELGSYTGTRGWAPEVVDAATTRLERRGWVRDAALTDEGRAGRAAVEAATDLSVQPLVDALGDDLDGVVQRLDAWSERCVAAGAFPPDQLKRAAG